MEVKKVLIQGNDNILRYAIKNQADILNDLELLDFITSDMVATVTLADVNFYELCRLSHYYRSKLRVIKEERIGDVPLSLFEKQFPGEFKDEETGELITSGTIIQEACERFLNIALQMESDEDIIPTWAGRLFIPMFYRRFVISVPIKFHEFVFALKETKMRNVFDNENYQDNIDNTLFTEDGSETLNNIILMFSKMVSSEIDSERSAQLVKLFKYQSLGKNQTKQLYHFTPIGFSKYNRLLGFDQKVSFFNGDPEKISAEMRSLSELDSPLKVSFAVQLPLHQLQVLERTFTDEDLKIDYLSRPAEIIENGIRFEDFIVQEYDDSVEDKETLEAAQEAAISVYRERIKSASSNAIAALAHLLSSNARTVFQTYGPSGLVSVLPAIATTSTVLDLDTSKIKQYQSLNDVLNKSMLSEMMLTASEINKTINQRNS